MSRIDRSELVPMLRRAAELRRDHLGITYEHGVRLVDLVGQWGDVLADALENAPALFAHEVIRNHSYLVKDAAGISKFIVQRDAVDRDAWVLRDMSDSFVDSDGYRWELFERYGIEMFHEEPE